MSERESTAVGLAEVLRPWTRHKSVFGICADNAANIQANSGVESFCRFVCSIFKAEVLIGANKALKAEMIFSGAAKIILDVPQSIRVPSAKMIFAAVAKIILVALALAWTRRPQLPCWLPSVKTSRSLYAAWNTACSYYSKMFELRYHGWRKRRRRSTLQSVRCAAPKSSSGN